MTIQPIISIVPPDSLTLGLVDLSLGLFLSTNNNRNKNFYEEKLNSYGFTVSNLNVLKSSVAFNNSYTASSILDAAGNFDYLKMWDDVIGWTGNLIAWNSTSSQTKTDVLNYFSATCDLMNEIINLEDIQSIERTVYSNPNKTLQELNLPITPNNIFLFNVLKDSTLKNGIISRFSQKYTFNGNLDDLIIVTPTFAAGRIMIETMIAIDNGALVTSIRSS